ncbi:hypothetical protein J4438_01025 [Candidatus Woesearchaeota archaeon]|nr:hypothetical protein [Candidatus Woesearchaeota archaeon]
MKTKTKKGLVSLVAASGFYLYMCIPASIRVNEALKQTKFEEMFTVRAENGPYQVVNHALDYNGDLDRIRLLRDDFLRQNNSVYMFGEWRSTRYGKNKPEPSADISGFAVCYNPFKASSPNED